MQQLNKMKNKQTFANLIIIPEQLTHSRKNIFQFTYHFERMSSILTM